MHDLPDVASDAPSATPVPSPAEELATSEESREAVPMRVVEDSRLHLHAQFHSNILPADRDLVVYVPETYDQDRPERYPVLYLHDGQNLFDANTAYIPGRIWGVHETADRLIAAGEIEPMIIVGIYNGGANRIKEYTPTRDPKMGGGDADLYGQMLIEEVKPWIDSRYCTQSGAAHTGLGGSSLGGLVTLFLGLKRPDVFGRLAVLSPSVWWNNKAILGYVETATPNPRPRIWLDMGTGEGKNTMRDSDMLFRSLSKRGWREGRDLLYTKVPGGTHDEAAWAMRVEPFLKFLFPATRV